MTSAPTPDVLPDDDPAAGTEDDGKISSGRIAAAIIFGLLALAFIVAGLIMVALPANQLPGLLGHTETSAHRSLRGVGSILVGVALTVSSWFALRYRSVALEEARAADLAAAGKATADADPAATVASQAEPADQDGQADAARHAAGPEAPEADSN